jgi:hypothetical protein
VQLLTETQLGYARELVTEIVTKASGVFLWVMVVVRSLLQGLRNRDDIEDLRRRLKELPSDLNSLYTHMLRHLEPLYREQASRTFRIYQVLPAYQENITSLSLELAVSGAAEQAAARTNCAMDEDEIRSRCDHLDVYLKTRCVGLLETHNQEEARIDDNPFLFRGFALILSTGRRRLLLARVAYLHRTVKDFLSTEDVQTVMLNTTKPDFNSHIHIAISYVIMIERSVFIGRSNDQKPDANSQISIAIWRAIWHARAGDIADGINSLFDTKRYLTIIDELCNAEFQMWNLNLDP